jgi:hypothetical protein
MKKTLVRIALLFICLFVYPVEMTAHELPFEEDIYLHINLWHKRIYLKNGIGETLGSFKIAPGAKDTPSPIGAFRIIQKSKGWGGGFGSHWLGLNVPWGIFGIHGTNRPEKIGSYVSHGCIRMKNRDIEKVFKRVTVGTAVIIDGPVMGHEDLTYRILVPGSKGALVQLVQNHLRAAGSYKGKVNGIFDYQMERAVIEFQKRHGLKVTGQIHFDDLQYLGIIE